MVAVTISLTFARLPGNCENGGVSLHGFLLGFVGQRVQLHISSVASVVAFVSHSSWITIWAWLKSGRGDQASPT
jgi:hypothetical protein